MGIVTAGNGRVEVSTVLQVRIEEFDRVLLLLVMVRSEKE
jgi:hypothetical protein